jgi:hypothetical protein
MSYSLSGESALADRYDASKRPRIVPLASYLGNVLILETPWPDFKDHFEVRDTALQKLWIPEQLFCSLPASHPSRISKKSIEVESHAGKVGSLRLCRYVGPWFGCHWPGKR